MTVRAVDLQTTISRIGEAGRVQAHLEQQPAVVQHVQTAQNQARMERAQHQVNQKRPVQEAALHPDGGGNGGGGRQPQSRSGGKGGAPKEAPAAEPGLGHKLDVKL